MHYMLLKMSWKDIMIRTLIFLVLGCFMINGCSALNRSIGLEDDNHVEELIEEVIEAQTGIEIDLTPEH